MLVYIGAIVVLFLFGIMLTRAKIGADQDLTNKHWLGGGRHRPAPVRRHGLRPIDEYHWSEHAAARPTRASPSVNGSNTATVSDSIFSTYLIPFEVVSVLLLAALVGAIVLARKD